MKSLAMIVWLMQLGFSIAIPPAFFVFLAVWLRNRFDLGFWIILVGIVLGIVGAIDGLRTSLKAMERMARDDSKKDPPPVSFNDHD